MELLRELYLSANETENLQRKIVGFVSNAVDSGDWQKIEAIAQIFEEMGHRDYNEGWIRGIPFSTDPKQLNTTLHNIVSNGDEMVLKRLFRKISGL